MYRPNVAIFVNKSDCIALNIDIFLHFMLSTVDNKRVLYRSYDVINRKTDLETFSNFSY